MTTRYFGVNTLAGAARTNINIVEDTTAGRFNSTYVANSISVPSGAGAGIDYLELGPPFMGGGSSITGTLWYRFDFFGLAFASGSFAWWALNGSTNAYRLTMNGGSTLQMQYWNTVSAAWVNWGSTFIVSTSNLYTIAIKLVLNTSFEVYINNISVLSSATVPTNGVATVDRFRHGSFNNVGGFGIYYSQLMAADYDIRDAHVLQKLANGEGTYTAGTGAYTAINEVVLDDSTAISLPASGNKHTFTKAAITVPSGYAITSMVVNVRGRVSGGVVTDGKIIIRSGSTDSAPGSESFSGAYEPRRREFALDPNTSSAWGQTPFNAAEFGLQAA